MLKHKSRAKVRMRNGQPLLSTPGIHSHSLRTKAQAAQASKSGAEVAEFVGFVRELAGLCPHTGAVYSEDELERRAAPRPHTWNDVDNIRQLRDDLEGITFSQVENVREAGGEIRQRSVQTSAFALVTSAITVRQVSKAYEDVETVSQELVEEMDDPSKVTFISNVLHEAHDVKEVPEGRDFPMIHGGEEKFAVGHRRNGRVISLSAELFEENKKAEIIQRLTDLGKLAAELIEEVSLEKITDHFGSGATPAAPYLLTMDGGKAFFQVDNTVLDRLAATGNRLLNTPLNDETSLTAARLLLAGQTNSRGKRIAFPKGMQVLLVPDALKEVAFKILSSEMVPGTVNEVNPWGPRGEWQPKLVSTPKLDDLSTSAWYYGYPRWSLVRKWKLRPETIMAGGMTGAYLPFLNSREGVRVRTAWDFEIGASDYVGWLQALALETAPVDA